MITGTPLKNKVLRLFCLSFCLIPVIKMIISATPNVPPVHLIPFVIMTFATLIATKAYLSKAYWICNLAIGIYSFPTLILASPMFDPVVIKYVLAAFVWVALAFIFRTFVKHPLDWQNFVQVTYRNLRYTTLFILFICLLSILISLVKMPASYGANDFFNLLTFSRDNFIMRNDFILRMNFAYVLTGNLNFVMMQGPQILIFPLIFSTIYFLFKKHITIRKIDIFLVIFLILAIFAINSRAMVLYLILLIGSTVIWPKIMKYERLLSFLILPFPLLLVFLSTRILNGRDVQINYTLSKISFFGHGIGSGLRDLYAIVASYAFDNIHLESIQYFGIVGYAALLTAFIYFIIVKKANRCFYITSVAFVFLSLNFNLFDPYFFIPVLLCLTEPLTTESKQTAL